MNRVNLQAKNKKLKKQLEEDLGWLKNNEAHLKEVIGHWKKKLELAEKDYNAARTMTKNCIIQLEEITKKIEEE